MKNTCPHTKYEQIGHDRCFTGSVAGPHGDENRAAHGGITYTVECKACGSRRDLNVNQNFVEEGPWGPSRAAQIAEARDRLRVARDMSPTIPEPITVNNRKLGISVRVVCAADGYLTIEGPHNKAHEAAILKTLPEAWVDQAKELREHHCLVTALEAAVA